MSGSDRRSTARPTASADVDAYLAALPPEQRATLDDLRAVIAKAAPEAEELISYGVPTFRYKKRPLVAFGAAKTHAGFYGMSGSVLEAFEADLAAYGTSKGTVRFPYGKKIPAGLVTKIVRARMAETDSKPAKK